MSYFLQFSREILKIVYYKNEGLLFKSCKTVGSQQHLKHYARKTVERNDTDLK